MKKADEYINESNQFDLNEGLHWQNKKYIIAWAKNVIKQAQHDAIDETVKACAEAAKLKFHDGFWKTDKRMDYFQSGVDNITVSKQSILEVADKLKEGL